jgi:ParB-like chromosome segregation protein Spo0J
LKIGIPHSLQPYPGNARTHSPKQIKQISRSIERFGFNNPALVDDGDQIIAGHGRVEAANLLNMKTVPSGPCSRNRSVFGSGTYRRQAPD